MADSEGLKIVVAHGSDDTRDAIVEALDDRHHVNASCGMLVQLRQIVDEQRPDLIVTGVVFPDGDGIQTVIELGYEHPIPSVVVTAERSIELVKRAMRDHVMAYLIEPVCKEDLEASIVVAWSRYEQLRELAGQVDDLREALAQRKIIERAKGMLMAADGISEGEAFALLRRRAQDGRKRIVDVAEDVLSEIKA